MGSTHQRETSTVGPRRPTQLGGNAFNHPADSDAEAEYDRLRGLARAEHAKMASCFDRAHDAYPTDGALAHTLSQQGKQHQALAKTYNAQTSAYIFRENNDPGRTPADTIDLHGQFVEEADGILTARIRAARARGEAHLHVVVGRGTHSAGHVQRIKPAVERVCREEGVSFVTEENEGRVFVDLRGGGGGGGAGYAASYAHPERPQSVQQQQQQPQPYLGGMGSTGDPSYPGQQQPPQMQFEQQQQQHSQQQQQASQDPITSCLKSCCTVM